MSVGLSTFSHGMSKIIVEVRLEEADDGEVLEMRCQDRPLKT